MKDKKTLRPREPDDEPLRFQTNPPHRILVVEDDESIRRLITQMLSKSGYAVDAAEDGSAAWDALGVESYDLMITDNSMPKVSGVELLSRLYTARMALPVIMATGMFPEHEFARRPWLQPAAMLLKPYTFDELLRKVKKVLREADKATDGYQRFRYSALNDDEPSPPGEPASPSRSAPANSPRRILVVDEDGDLRRLYAEALAGSDCSVDAAEDGAAGWEALQANRYDLLITENDLRNLSGVELIEKVRAARMALPVVMAAGRLPADELARNPALRLAATLSKPFPVDALLDTVQTILRATAGSARQT